MEVTDVDAAVGFPDRPTENIAQQSTNSLAGIFKCQKHLVALSPWRRDA